MPDKLFVRSDQILRIPSSHACAVLVNLLYAIPLEGASSGEPFLVAQPSWLWGQRASCPFLPRLDRARCPIAPQAGSLCYGLVKPHPSSNFPNHFPQRQKFLYRRPPPAIFFLDD